MNKAELDKFIKWVLTGLIVLAAIYFFPWGDITWGRVILKNEGMITVTGYAETDEKNQIAMFTAGVNAINDNKDMAVNEVNTKMANIIQSVKDLGVDPADIQTQQLSVYQMQESAAPQTGRVKLGQWNASNTIQITLRDVSKAGTLTDTLTKSGANNVFGPNFQLDTTAKAGDKLLGAAIDDARSKAMNMAAASGAKLGRVISVVEGTSTSPTIYPMQAFEKSISSVAPAPTEVGTTKISKTVTVVFGLR